MDYFGKLVLAATAGAGLAFGGVAAALTPPPSALPNLSTPASANAHTPTVATPAVATPEVSTPAQGVGATVAPIALPTGVGIQTSGLVGRTISTPTATPTVSRVVDVPTVNVRTISVPAVTVGSIPVSITLPAAAQVSGNGAAATAAGGLVTTQSTSGGSGPTATVRAGTTTASVQQGR